MQDAPIGLTDYDPRWPRLFDQECEALGTVLAPWLTGRIEHIGSTAVPGLIAKPVIDIMAPVSGLAESKDAIGALQALDYQYAPYRPDVMHWFCKPHFSHRTHHLHLVPLDSELWVARLAFRDCLRQDAAIAAAYADLKRCLAVSFAHDREAYTEGKTEFVGRVVSATSQERNLGKMSPG